MPLKPAPSKDCRVSQRAKRLWLKEMELRERQALKSSVASGVALIRARVEAELQMLDEWLPSIGARQAVGNDCLVTVSGRRYRR